MRLLIAMSGPIAVGKSAFIAELLKQIKGTRVSTRELILSLRDVPSERGPLQEAGDSLDRETNGKWVADALTARVKDVGDNEIAVVDSVRIADQVKHLRAAYGNKIKHLHLTASLEVLTERFMERKRKGDPAVKEFATYEEARANATEAGVEKLGQIADVLIKTDEMSAEATAALAIQKLGLNA